MSLVVYAEASGAENPGHMIVGQEPDSSDPSYYGYRFDIADLPEGYRSPARWREYLFTNPVPGNIVDESAYVIRLRGENGRVYYRRRGECTVVIATMVPPMEQWRHHASYSFNPDDFHTDGRPCYNCVTWATGIANRLVVAFLIPVRQGRAKEILKQLQVVSALGEAAGG